MLKEWEGETPNPTREAGWVSQPYIERV